MPTRGTAFENARYLRERYTELRALGLCVRCKGQSDGQAVCKACGKRLYAKRRKVAA